MIRLGRNRLGYLLLCRYIENCCPHIFALLIACVDIIPYLLFVFYLFISYFCELFHCVILLWILLICSEDFYVL